MSHDLDQPVDDKAAALLLGVSRKTMQNWRQQGIGPEFLRYDEKGRPIVRYLPSVLIRFRDQFRRRSTSDPGPGGGP